MVVVSDWVESDSDIEFGKLTHVKGKGGRETRQKNKWSGHACCDDTWTDLEGHQRPRNACQNGVHWVRMGRLLDQTTDWCSPVVAKGWGHLYISFSCSWEHMLEGGSGYYISMPTTLVKIQSCFFPGEIGRTFKMY